MPFYWIRIVGGLLFFSGGLMAAVNFFMTWKNRPAVYDVPVYSAPALSSIGFNPEVAPESKITNTIETGKKLDTIMSVWWHRVWERKPLLFAVMTFLAVASASLFEIIPTFLIKSNVPSIASVKPYTPLELAGRDVYIAEGCYNCHSQMIRPIYAEVKRYGEYSKPGEFVYDHPFQWGSRRIGPDLAREGGRQSNLWHAIHFNNPRDINDKSIMPAYSFLLSDELDFGGIQARVRVMAMLGVPYGDAVKDGVAEQQARAQATLIADEIAKQNPPEELRGLTATKKVIALIAYMQRMGRDIAPPPEVPVAPAPATPAAAQVPDATTPAQVPVAAAVNGTTPPQGGRP
jgi:cytochrome c oxidase cbb3-type subunit I/II